MRTNDEIYDFCHNQLRIETSGGWSSSHDIWLEDFEDGAIFIHMRVDSSRVKLNSDFHRRIYSFRTLSNSELRSQRYLIKELCPFKKSHASWRKYSSMIRKITSIEDRVELVLRTSLHLFEKVINEKMIDPSRSRTNGSKVSRIDIPSMITERDGRRHRRRKDYGLTQHDNWKKLEQRPVKLRSCHV